MKRLLAMILALLFCTASLSSCTVLKTGGSDTTEAVADEAVKETDAETKTTDGKTEPPPSSTSGDPAKTTAATTSPPPAVTTAKPEPPPATTAEPDLPTEDPEDQYYTKNY